MLISFSATVFRLDGGTVNNSSHVMQDILPDSLRFQNCRICLQALVLLAIINLAGIAGK